MGGTIMPKFKVGDHVERIGPLVPVYMSRGIITLVIPNKDGLDLFTEYEANFDDQLIANFYETQLRLVELRPNRLQRGLDLRAD
jgi:hypothetical protein